jgi:hypothetical protein
LFRLYQFKVSYYVAQYFVFAMLLQTEFVAEVIVNNFFACISLHPVPSDCTHGSHFVADADAESAKVHAYEIVGPDKPVLSNTIETFSGLGPQYLYTSSTDGTITALYRGKTENSWLGGTLVYVHTDSWKKAHRVHLSSCRMLSCRCPLGMRFNTRARQLHHDR